MSKTPPERVDLSDQLRRIINEHPESRYRIALETGLSESQLSKFMAKQRGLSMEALDVLGRYLDLELTVRRRPKTT